MNVVMNDGGGFIELQGTAEGPRLPPRRTGRAARCSAGKGVQEPARQKPSGCNDAVID
jgi:hypothetical protein